MTQNTQSTILVYNERPAAIGSLLPALRDSFANRAIDLKLTDLSDIKLQLQQPLTAFVLPGIIGTDSPYPDQLTPDIVKTLHDKIENGMVGIFICAGAAFLSRETRYDPPWGPPKRRNQLQHIFNGLAKGPVNHLAKMPDDDIGGITLAPVTYNLPDGTPRKASIYYGNGTYFLPDDENDPNTKVIARLDTVEGKPPAIVRVQKGKGFAYFMAVHPEIGPVALSKDTTVKDQKGLKKLTKALSKHESGRKELWGMIMDDIINHRSAMAQAAYRNSPKI
jgi:glutamine amidotransferase-like uncharacterized protein